MTRLVLLVGCIGAICLPMLSTTSAQAQTRTWVSGVGDDLNPCSRTAPCKTFAGAISKTAAGGEIDCLDPGGFGTVTITKSITIDCGTVTGGILAAGTNGVNVNGPGIVVRLRGLVIQGVGTGLIGVNATNMAALYIENCDITGFNAGTAIGIAFKPSTSPSLLFVTNTTVDDNGTGAAGGGIQLAPAAGGSVGATLNNVRLWRNVTGIALTATNGAVTAELSQSVVASSFGTGVLSTGGASAIKLMINQTSIVNNAGTGVSSSGASTVLIGGSTISGNTTGVSGATLQSFKNNQIGGNGTDGTPITAFPGPGGTPLQ